MKNVFTPAGKFVYRNPMWSSSKLETLDEGALKQALEDPFFREALWIASPVLFDEAEKWRSGQLAGKEARKVAYSLVKYYSRLCTRATPFGLFASCSAADLPDAAAEAPAQASNGQSYSRITRIDMEFLCKLIHHIENDPEIRPFLRYSRNTSLYRIDDHYRYVEFTYQNNRKKYTITALDADDYLDRVIDACTGRQVEYGALAGVLDDPELDPAEIEAYISELIDSQVIISNISPTVIGADLLNQLIDALQDIPSDQARSYVSRLSEIRSRLRTLDAQFVNDIARYKELIDLIAQLGIGYDVNKLFQVDVYRDDRSHDPGLDADSLFGAFDYLFQSAPSEMNPTLKAFIDKFRERYETEEVRLIKVLDPDIGIGYPVSQKNSANTPLADELNIGMPRGGSSMNVTDRDHAMFKVLLDATKKREYSVDLSALPAPKEKKDAGKQVEDFQASWQASFRKVREGDHVYTVFEHAGGNSAGDLIGRFGHLHEQMSELIGIVSGHERRLYDGTDLADIIHLPELRAGNILFRPEINAYQIPFLGRPTVADEQVISIDDIYIRISGSNKIVLRSGKTGRPFIPRLSNAHNYSANSLPIYHFLCDVQNQSPLRGVGFHWGSFANQFRFHPRVTYKDVILHMAEWTVEASEIAPVVELFKKEGYTAAVREKLAAWRETVLMPRKVLLVYGDNELYVDFDNELSASTFLDEIKKQPMVNLKEFMESASGDGFMYQYQLPLLRKITQPARPRETPANPGAQRKFLPGSKVLYFKIYGGEKILEKKLINSLYPLVHQYCDEGRIDKWFFIRYSDPENHVRVRLFLAEGEDGGAMMAAFNEALAPDVAGNVLAKVQLDTYAPEWERYPQMAHSEEFFYRDSECVARLLEHLQYNGTETNRWQWALADVDQLLDAAGLDLAAKQVFIKRIRDSFFQEFGGSVSLNQALSTIFRNHRKEVEAMLFQPEEIDETVRAILLERQAFIVPLFAAIKAEAGDAALEDMLGSFIHMTLNRLVLSAPRKHELMLYDFLERAYKSMGARKSPKTAAPEEAPASELR